jgi:hypothetical protein
VFLQNYQAPGIFGINELFFYRRLDASSASMAAGSGPPPAKPRAPAWASVFGDPSRTVDMARATS